MLYLLLACLSVDQSPVPDHIVKWQRNLTDMYDRFLAEETTPLKRLLAAKRPVNGPGRKRYDVAIKAFRERSDAALAKEPADFAKHIRLQPKPSVGDIGTVDSFRITRVISKDRAIVEIEFNTGELGARGPAVGPAMLSGIDTSKWADDSVVRLKDTFEVTGIDKSTGTSLVMLKPFDVKKWAPKKPETTTSEKK